MKSEDIKTGYIVKLDCPALINGNGYYFVTCDNIELLRNYADRGFVSLVLKKLRGESLISGLLNGGFVDMNCPFVDDGRVYLNEE